MALFLTSSKKAKAQCPQFFSHQDRREELVDAAVARAFPAGDS